jgi:membrane-bound lytic murein transglycosylase D
MGLYWKLFRWLCVFLFFIIASGCSLNDTAFVLKDDLPPQTARTEVSEPPPNENKSVLESEPVPIPDKKEQVSSTPLPSPPEKEKPSGEKEEGKHSAGKISASSKTETASGAEDSETETATETEEDNQSLLDSALDYYQASNDFWEQGDLDNAIDALDKAYSLILRVDQNEGAEILQQKEDLRITISKKIVEVYASRFTAVNGYHKAIPLVMNRHVKKAIDLFTGRDKNFFLAAYKRSGKYRPAIVKALKEEGLPEELSWLPLIESGYKIRALSRARALGLWQFIASTGYKFGLKRDAWIDERMDPEKSTRAAIAYLKELHNIFGDWSTVLAGYNCGELRVLRNIKKQKINYLDNFWDLYETLPRETAFYIPKFLAVLHILNDPKAYGFELPAVDEPTETEKVNVGKQMHLKTIAEQLDLDYSLLKDLNPELRRYLTPSGPYALKVPSGKGDTLQAKLKDIPAYKPPVPFYVVHQVRRGESLSVIADRYRTSVRAIMAANNLNSKHFIRAGWKLKIPTGKKFVPAVRAPVVSTPSDQVVKYVVRKGDSLWKIANQYQTTTKALMAHNHLRNSELQIGQVLLINPGVSVPLLDQGTQYRVKKGDSPYLIAKRYRMNLADFLRMNNLTPRSMIFPGQMVSVINN